MFPWSVDCKKKAPTSDLMNRVAKIGALALKNVYGTKYVVGGICKTIYPASGSTVDWGYAEGGVKYPYAIELRDTGKYGFLLPPEFIIPSGEETFAGIIAISNAILKEEA